MPATLTLHVWCDTCDQLLGPPVGKRTTSFADVATRVGVRADSSLALPQPWHFVAKAWEDTRVFCSDVCARLFPIAEERRTTGVTPYEYCTTVMTYTEYDYHKLHCRVCSETVRIYRPILPQKKVIPPLVLPPGWRAFERDYKQGNDRRYCQLVCPAHPDFALPDEYDISDPSPL